MKDEDIDYSDIPPLDETFFTKPTAAIPVSEGDTRRMPLPEPPSLKKGNIPAMKPMNNPHFFFFRRFIHAALTGVLPIEAPRLFRFTLV